MESGNMGAFAGRQIPTFGGQQAPSASSGASGWYPSEQIDPFSQQMVNAAPDPTPAPAASQPATSGGSHWGPQPENAAAGPKKRQANFAEFALSAMSPEFKKQLRAQGVYSPYWDTGRDRLQKPDWNWGKDES